MKLKKADRRVNLNFFVFCLVPSDNDGIRSLGHRTRMIRPFGTGGNQIVAGFRLKIVYYQSVANFQQLVVVLFESVLGFL